jgi:Bacterial regulatory proteins, luxR family
MGRAFLATAVVTGGSSASFTIEMPLAQLFISESTVKTHLLHIYEKLGVRDRAAAVGEAYKRRLLS